MSNDESFAYVTEAKRIGRWLARTALWKGDACTWVITTSNRMAPRGSRATQVAAGGDLYQGTAGIALFLSDLYSVTGELAFRRTALGALTHAVTWSEQLPRSAFGFYTGRVGVAYALTRHATLTSNGTSRDDALRVIAPLFGSESEDRVLDVIGGAAGAIPALLHLADALDCPSAHASALALGARLLATAHRRPEGWSWGNAMSGSAWDLCGMAHGAAGVAYGLLELWRCTKEPTLLYAALRAVDYESARFQKDAQNWPDYRQSEWSEYLSSPEQLAGVKLRLEEGCVVPGYELRTMSAWCHGAPGIGLARARAFELLGLKELAEDVRIACDASVRSLSESTANYSLCHGHFGNLETLIAATHALGDSSWLEIARRFVDRAITVVGGGFGRWPSGALSQVPDPSLMLGESGIGHSLLRWADSGLPPVLLPCVGARGEPRDVTAAALLATSSLAEEEQHGWFAQSLRVGRQLGVGGRIAAAHPGGRSPSATAEALRRTIQVTSTGTLDGYGAGVGCLLADACALELAVHDTAVDQQDYISDHIAQLLRRSVAGIDWSQAMIAPVTGTRLVHVEFDWPAWLDARATGQLLSHPSSLPRTYVIYPRGGRVNMQLLAPFAARVLAIVVAAPSCGISIRQVAQCLVALIDRRPHIDSLVALIQSQAIAAYDAGILRVAV